MKKYSFGIVVCFFLALFYKNHGKQINVADDVKDTVHIKKNNYKHLQNKEISLLEFQKSLDMQSKIKVDNYFTCRKCFRILSNILLSKKENFLSKKNAAITLARMNNKDSISLLLNSLNESDMNSDDLQKIIKEAVIEINIENSGLLTQFLVDDAVDEKKIKLNQFIKNSIYEHLFGNANEQLKHELISLFNSTEYPDVKNNIIDLENPDVSREIFFTAYNEDNQELQTKIIDKLAFSHDEKSLDLLLEISNKFYSGNDTWLSENIDEWLNANSYNGGYNHLLEHLNNPNISQETRNIIVDILEKSLSYSQDLEIKSKIEATVAENLGNGTLTK